MHMLDEGENFRLFIHERIAVFQVWARPDVCAEEGARMAGIAMNTLRGLLGDADAEVTGLVFDARLAPGSVGPTTQAQLSDVFRSWAIAERRVAVLAGDDALQQQMTNVLDEVAPGLGLSTPDEGEAYAHARAAG
jgi:hypothetical protein